MPDFLLDCLALHGLFGWLVFPPGACGSFWQFFWCCGSGLFASQCGFHVYVSVLCCVCMCAGGILLAEVGSCLQSGSQQSPDL